MESFSDILTEILPALLAGGGLLWNFSKEITRIQAKLQALEHQINDSKGHIESNRQGRIEVFSVINNVLKPRDNSSSERIARLEEKVSVGVDAKDIYSRLSRLEAELKCIEEKVGSQ